MLVVWQPLSSFFLANNFAFTYFLIVVLQKGLKENFADAQVSVVDCPDLTQEPFNFPAKGNLVLLTSADVSKATNRVQVVFQVKNLHERKATFYSCIC